MVVGYRALGTRFFLEPSARQSLAETIAAHSAVHQILIKRIGGVPRHWLMLADRCSRKERLVIPRRATRFALS